MNETNLLDLVPLRLVAESQRIEGCVCVEFPRFRSAPGRLFGRAFRASRTIRLTLDDKSTAVWDLIDGRRSVEQIGATLQRKYGEEIEPVYERLAKLLEIMVKNQLIRYET